MRLTLRTQSNFLIIPLAIALAALLAIALKPYFIVNSDIQGADEDLRGTLAILDFTEGIMEQSRECADLLVTGAQDDLREIRDGGANARRALSIWRDVPKNRPDEPELVQRIDRELTLLTASTEQLIALTKLGRHAEATALLHGEIRERSAAMLRLADQALSDRREDIGRHVARISGGIRYSGFLKAGTLASRIDDLDAHITEVVESAALRNAIEAETWAGWRLYLTKDHSLDGEIALQRNRAEGALENWRMAVASDGGESGRANAKADLRMIEDISGDYQRLRTNGLEVHRLMERGSDEAARALLIRSMQFEHSPAGGKIEAYIDRQSGVARRNLVSLRAEVLRVRRVVGLTGMLILLAG
ncbi:MAG: hypothetical protein QOE82_1637, partial [Thermoanaerobaculia bacterium]|nr:hypothetical protein [Thermoanaerobaculia bacterium]